MLLKHCLPIRYEISKFSYQNELRCKSFVKTYRIEFSYGERTWSMLATTSLGGIMTRETQRIEITIHHPDTEQ